MNALRAIRNYFCYCGIEKDEYNALKKDAYVANFEVWRLLHCLMLTVFAGLLSVSLFNEMVRVNRLFYLAIFIYSAASAAGFFLLKKDSLLAQLWIYLTISVLFLFAAFLAQSKPDTPATTFIVLLVITPMFMIDKPFFMAIELCAAAAVYLTWMHGVKPHMVWLYDFINVVTYTLIGVFLHIIANSIRIREFVLTRKINIQKDTDEMTGLKTRPR